LHPALDDLCQMVAHRAGSLVLQQGGVSQDHRQRRTQFVGRDVQELTLQFVQLREPIVGPLDFTEEAGVLEGDGGLAGQ